MLVEYTLGEADSVASAGERRPALMVRQWSADTANLVVFVDGTNDGPRLAGCILWATSRKRGDGEPYTWRELATETTETTTTETTASIELACDVTDADE